MQAPDVFAAAVDRSTTAIGNLLRTGRGRMPAFDTSPERVADLCALLAWTSANRRELVRVNDRLLDRTPFSWAAMPWFEYQ
jgi:hypothetical protein